MYTHKELEAAGLTDFRVFLRQVWDFLRLPEPTPVQNDIGHYLQHGPRRLIVQAFRGVGKSWITVAFVLWSLLLDPQLKILVVSANQQLADNFSKFAKQLIHGMPLLQHLAARDGQRDSAVEFDVGPAMPSKDPSVKSAGITGQITGSRADIIVPDDIEVPKNSYTHLLRERLAELVKEFDAVLKPNGRVRYLGTPQAEATVYNKLVQRGYEIRIWPTEIPESTEVYGERLAPYILKLISKGVKPHTAVDPKRFNDQEIAERKASYGLTGFALQFMLDTNPSDVEKHPLKTKDLLIHDVDHELAHVKLVWGGDRTLALQDLQSGGYDGDYYVKPMWKSEEMTKYTGTVMAIDPSGKGQDETGYAIVKNLHGLLYLVDVGGFTSGFAEETLKALAMRAIRWGVNDIIIEENYGGGMFNALLKPVLIRIAQDAKASCPRIDDEWDGWSSTQKEFRILDTLEPIVQSHRLIVDRRVIENDLIQQRDRSRYSFIQQFTRIERLKGCLPNEDRLEAVSMACGYYTARMSKDQDKAVAQHREALKDAELKKFVENAMNAGRPTSKWGGQSRYLRWHKI